MKRVEQTLFCHNQCKKQESFPLNTPIYVNDPLSNAPAGFPSNEIRTTKYTLLSFLPKNLLEQFRRYQNFYFLLVCIPTLIPSVSPITPASAILPFLAILLVAAVKEAWEDWKRWKQDSEYNSRKYEVYRDSLWVNIFNRDIQTGDLICLKEGEEVPADVVMISCSHSEGVCYFETANLDGETYLKQSVARPELQPLTKDKITQIHGVMNVAAPDKALYNFKGTLTLSKEAMLVRNPLDNRAPAEGSVYSLDGKQLLMRGVRIRNTKTVTGIVVYTGPNTKLALNQVSTPSKFSRTEKLTNWVTVLIFILQMTLVISCTIATAVEHGEGGLDYLYGNNKEESTGVDAGRVFASYFVLMAYFIPISLFVNLEVIKVAQAYFISVDEQMMMDGKGATVQNSNLNDELSRVSYIFSDKTGTLTQNKMIFDSCSIDGVNYRAAGQGELKSKLKDKEVLDFFLNLALNNEALAEDTGGKMPHYAAPSPDDIALVKGSYLNGVQLVGRDTRSITLKIDGVKESYEILYILPFTSQRKRSSVIVRTPTGNIMMYTKGADSIVLRRLEKNNAMSNVVKNTKKHITEYSIKGFRTLVIARKELSKTDLDNFAMAYDTASKAIDKREELVDQVMERIETDLFLQGCTAIEDKLQDNVAWTIDYFIKSGIRVWMITGDKQETAENIGKSCKLISEDSTLVRVVEAKDSNECGDMMQTAKKVLRSENKVSLIIDSTSLIFALVDYRQELLEIGEKCSSVIVCRAEPLQKAQVVSLVKKGSKKICLAIGDGANDVSMIQEAHIGVGIWGEEGTQAARNSDYSIRQFKHLARLVTVHGRYNMLRTGLMVEFSFYKNLAMFLVQFWFAPYCLWSSQTFYDDWVMAGFNTILLSAPPLCLALFEKDLEEEYPEAYKELRDGLYFTPQSFVRWMISAIWHSLVFFFLYVLAIPDAMSGRAGLTADLVSNSTLVAAAAVITIILRAAIITKYWVWVSHAAYWGSMILMIFLFLIESAFPNYFPSFYQVMPFVMRSPWFWFYIPGTVMLCLVPDIIYEVLQREFRPWNYQIIRETAVKKGYQPLKRSGHVGGFVDVKLSSPASESLEDSLVALSIQEPSHYRDGAGITALAGAGELDETLGTDEAGISDSSDADSPSEGSDGSSSTMVDLM